ncbi:MAG TPA: class II aldolase/adducin family protein [Bryobacteraceae bacterium]|jgi:rhamnose utilization protein RhaD (predicted bifunctional aldolase and dehydrogenase)|nr:class II aldolase/adducin family protein [Bryobacteraceae bacterium]
MAGFPEMHAFLALSARIGSDPLLVQASSGNTSLKANGAMCIKGSGKWLAHAGEPGSFVQLPLDSLRASLDRNEDVAAIGGPSIETAMHAVIPRRVVIHVHSVNTIAWAVRRDGEERLGERLAGLPWRWIPYVASGLPLARAIQAALAVCPDTNIFVLANHGLVICGDDCTQAAETLHTVEQRVAISPRNEPQTDDPVTARILQRGVLYPCQAMFFGVDPLVLNAGFRNSLTETQQAVLSGLLHVCRRIEESASLRYLTDSELHDLFSHDVHGYLASVENNAVKEAAPSAAPAVARAGN